MGALLEPQPTKLNPAFNISHPTIKQCRHPARSRMPETPRIWLLHRHRRQQADDPIDPQGTEHRPVHRARSHPGAPGPPHHRLDARAQSGLGAREGGNVSRGPARRLAGLGRSAKWGEGVLGASDGRCGLRD